MLFKFSTLIHRMNELPIELYQSIYKLYLHSYIFKELKHSTFWNYLQKESQFTTIIYFEIETNNISFLKWYFRRHPYGYMDMFLINVTIYYQRIHLLKWLFRTKRIDFSHFEDYMQIAIYLGNLYVIKWFLKRPFLSNLLHSEQLMDWAIRYNQFHVIKWFYKYYASIPNISNITYCIEHNYIDILIWLLKEPFREIRHYLLHSIASKYPNVYHSNLKQLL